MARTKAEIVTYLRDLDEDLEATWDGEAGNADRFFCQGANVDEDTHEVLGFRAMEQGDGPQSSAGYGEFQVEVLGVTFSHDGDEDCWEDNEWECDEDLEDGELPDDEDVDEALQEALDEKVGHDMPDVEERCESLSDGDLEEAFEEGGYDAFFVDAGEETPRTVYAVDSGRVEADALTAFKDGKREVVLSEAVRILQKRGYDIEMVY